MILQKNKKDRKNILNKSKIKTEESQNKNLLTTRILSKRQEIVTSAVFLADVKYQ